MLTLWYIILGWKEYNKPFRKVAEPAKPENQIEKPDLIPQKKDGKSTDIKKPEQPKSIPSDPKPPSAPTRASDSPATNNKTREVPKLPEINPNFQKSGETPKIPELPKVAPKIPETPRTPEPSNPVPEFLKNSDVPKTPGLPKLPSKSGDGARSPDQAPKVPPRPADVPKASEGRPAAFPVRSPESAMPDFPPSSRNPAYVPPSGPPEFSLPPFVPGAPPARNPSSKDEELFGPRPGKNLRTPDFDKPLTNPRDLSYSKGELSDEDLSETGRAFGEKLRENASRVPKYMEQSVISNPDSLESDEEDE